MLSDRAVALARRTGDQAARLRAEALALFASNRLGQGVPATVRALAAVRDAEVAGDAEVVAELRVELAWCARSAGNCEVSVRVLNPVLEQERIEPEVRAHALLALAASLPAHQQDGQRSEALDEAERLYETCGLSRDTARLLKARVRAARAGHHRRLGEFGEAVAAADAGLALLGQLGDPAADSGEIRTRLILERVQSLLELGRRPEAVQATESVLAQPVRAAAAGPVGWLGLAMATRVHLPDGNHGAAVRTLNDTAAISERHKLDGLLAEALNALSHVHERGAEFPEALRALRGAYAADRRWRAAVHNARVRLLAEYPVLAGDVEVPLRSSGPSRPAPHEPVPQGPDPVGARAVVPEQPAYWPPEPRQPERDAVEPAESEHAKSEQGDAHDAARRLMETLTSRAAGKSEGRRRRQEMPEPRISEESAQPTVVLDPATIQPAEPEADQLGAAAFPAAEPVEAEGGGQFAHAETVEAEGGRFAPTETVAFPPPADQGVPGGESEPEEHADQASASSQASWWPSEGSDQPSGAERTIPEVPVAYEPQQDQPGDAGLQAETSALAATLDNLRRTAAAAGRDSSAADLTTIMPVIGGPAGPGDWSGTGQTADSPVADPLPEAARADFESQYGQDPTATEPAAGRPRGHRADHALPLEPSYGESEAAPATEPPTIQTSTIQTSPADVLTPDTPAADDPAVESAGASAAGTEQREGGRRSRGKSLAEIRAGLQLSAEPRPGRRRARHAEPAEPPEPIEPPELSAPAVTSPTPAAELLGRHRQDWATEPNLPVVEPQPSPPAAGTSEPAGDREAPEPLAATSPPATLPAVEPPAADAGAAEKIGLAELLTEALMAYESGRREQPEVEEAAPSGRHSEARVSGVTGRPQVSRSAHSSTSDDRSPAVAPRHRRAAGDSTAVDPLF
ncbi:hypothetical protein [Saccharopolyspora elongata]|uniref:Tetratricopeptide repeat protein n=1 Tax=Saccharopolyspora elongata TaxID=2530387 RepID=A0A4R4YYC9_9PSEU|nr:hypothetical protein [Saccharopolyspora elongata]TDD49624.1 hypothetical protein E1288_19115 [Saccharopolyspora elongata]